MLTTRRQLSTEDLDKKMLTGRVYNLLRRQGIDNLGFLLALSDKEILRMRNFGKDSLRVITAHLEKLGVKLFEDDNTSHKDRLKAVYGNGVPVEMLSVLEVLSS